MKRAGQGSWKTQATAALAALLLPTLVSAQDWQLTFDANGNLAEQAEATAGLPRILGQPQNQVVVPGESASFSVVAADPRGLSYQWRLNGAVLPGATRDTLFLLNVRAGDEGQYLVEVANAFGTTTSSAAMLMLDSDADGMGDSWEQKQFGSLAHYPTSDADGDGVSNLTEFRDGTDAADSASAIFRLTLLSDGGQVAVTPGRFGFTNGETVTLTATAYAPHAFHAWGGDIDDTNNPLTLTIASNTTVFAYLGSYDVQWRNGANGDWHHRANWSPKFVPASNDHVIIPNGQVANNAAVACRRLTFGSTGGAPTLAGSGTLSVLERCDWLGGTLAGMGRTVVEPSATLIAAGGTLWLTGGTLENRGTTLWTLGNIFFDNSVIDNRPGAIFDARGGGVLSARAGNPRFHNEGTFLKSVGAGTATAEVPFNNYHTVEIQSGTFACTRGLLNNGAIHLGNGATIRISGGSGSGSFHLASSALAEWNGAFSLNPGAELNGPGLYRINHGTLHLNTAVAVGNLDLLAGTLRGPGALTIGGSMLWRSGTMDGGGRTTVAPGATLTIDTPGGVALYERTLDNDGTILWTGAEIVMSGSVITNRSLFHAQGTSQIRFGLLAGNRFDNAGTFRKSGSTGTTTISGNVSFNNYGTLEIWNGKVAANGGYASRSNSLLHCALGGTTAGTGFGQLQAAGPVTLNGSLRVDMVNGFVPTETDSFAVLTAGTRSGTFNHFLYPSHQVSMQMSNAPNAVIVRVTGVVTNLPAPLLLTPTVSGTNITLTWTATTNVAYRVEFKPNLNEPNWTALPGDVTTLGNTASKLEGMTPSNRFYRVRVVP